MLLRQATYTLTSDNKLEMDFKAESDAPSPVALTNHAYWNLSGNLKSKVTEGQVIRLAASRYLVLGENMVSSHNRKANKYHCLFVFCFGDGVKSPHRTLASVEVCLFHPLPVLLSCITDTNRRAPSSRLYSI